MTAIEKWGTDGGYKLQRHLQHWQSDRETRVGVCGGKQRKRSLRRGQHDTVSNTALPWRRTDGTFSFSVGSGASVTAACSGAASPRTCTAT